MLYDYAKQQERKQKLQAARRDQARKSLKEYSTGDNKGRAKKAIRQAKDIAKTATPIGVLRLLAGFNLIADWTYGIALVAAILKDLVDPIEFTGIGYIIVIVVTFCVSALIGFMMFLGDVLDSSESSSSRVNRKIIRSWLILGGGTAVEMVFGLDVLPFETLTVILVYIMALYARKEARQARKKEEQAEAVTENQLEPAEA